MGMQLRLGTGLRFFGHNSPHRLDVSLKWTGIEHHGFNTLGVTGALVTGHIEDTALSLPLQNRKCYEVTHKSRTKGQDQLKSSAYGTQFHYRAVMAILQPRTKKSPAGRVSGWTGSITLRNVLILYLYEI